MENPERILNLNPQGREPETFTYEDFRTARSLGWLNTHDPRFGTFVARVEELVRSLNLTGRSAVALLDPFFLIGKSAEQLEEAGYSEFKRIGAVSGSIELRDFLEKMRTLFSTGYKNNFNELVDHVMKELGVSREVAVELLVPGSASI